MSINFNAPKKELPLPIPQRRFVDPPQVRKRQNTPLPQGTHEEPFDAKLWWIAVLISWAVVGLIIIGIKVLVMP